MEQTGVQRRHRSYFNGLVNSDYRTCEQTSRLTAHEVVHFDIFKLGNFLHEVEVWSMSREDGL